MNTRGLLDQLLKSGQDLLQQKSGGSSAGGLGGLLGSVTGGGNGGSGDLGTLLKGAGGGALAAGALGLLLGNKSARKLGGKALTYGGLAALGVIAYKAYGNWQAQQQGAAQPVREPQTVDRLPAPQAELHSQPFDAIAQQFLAASGGNHHASGQAVPVGPPKGSCGSACGRQI